VASCHRGRPEQGCSDDPEPLPVGEVLRSRCDIGRARLSLPRLSSIQRAAIRALGVTDVAGEELARDRA